MAARVVATNVVDPRVIISVLTAVKRGDFSARLPANWTGSAGRVASALNNIIESNERLERDLQKLGTHVGEIEQRRAEVEAAKDRVEVKASQLATTSRYKSEFLANMSHELRTPLNSLLILAQELTDNPDGNLLPKQIEYATIIRSSGADLLKLINDILDLSKIESGTVALEIGDWPLAELPSLLERTFRHVAEATRLGFTIDLRPGLPKYIPTDPRRLQQILNNLLSNAFKFTETGRVAFAAEPVTSGWSHTNESLERADGVIALSVADTGIGIPREKQEAIFEPFGQGDGSTSRKYGGTGLGLSICRELTRMLGGEIKLDSETGRGSTFTVFLPTSMPAPAAKAGGGSANGSATRSPEEVTLEAARVGSWRVESRSTRPAGAAGRAPKPRAAHQAPRVLDSPNASLKNKKVLVVDDDVRNIFALTAMLERQQMEVYSVDSGREALDTLAQNADIDIAVVDVMMPEMDGYETMAKMRELPTFKERPIIALTAKAMKGDRERCIEAGASDYIAKPVNNSHLLAILTSWLNVSRHV
jgi:hypothetical protein